MTTSMPNPAATPEGTPRTSPEEVMRELCELRGSIAGLLDQTLILPIPQQLLEKGLTAAEADELRRAAQRALDETVSAIVSERGARA